MPDIGDGNLLIRVELAGVCGTDLALMNGYGEFSGVPGHEFTGTVVEGPESLVGSRIVSEINIGCGRCEGCKRGLRNHCLHRKVIGIRKHQGAFAEFVRVPEENVWVLPRELESRYAVLIEPLAASLEILEQVSVDAETRILVVGAGRLAQLVAQVLVSISDHVVVLARRRARRIAFAPLPVCCIGQGDVCSATFDLVVECSGHPGGLTIALDAVRPRGTIVMKSTYATSVDLDASHVVINEIALLGSRCGPFDKALEWLEANRVELTHLNFEVFPLEAYAAAFEAARESAIYKVLFDPAIAAD